jgi:hypothetical protein
MVPLRRFLVLIALFFWQGGFTFYASIVVPIGTDVLRSSRRQGFITRLVTRDLNLSGAIALAPLAWDLAAGRDPSRRRRLARVGFWLGLAATQAALFWLHPHLDSLLQVKGGIVLDPEAFRPLHRLYLWLSTAQWACGLGYLGLAVLAWRAEDRRDAGKTG